MNFIEKNTKKVMLILGLATAFTAVTTVYAASNTDGWHDGVYLVNGQVKTKWLFEEEGGIYYLNEQGRPETGWKTINNYTYYFDAEGKRVSGKVVIDGHKYTFQNNGVLMLGWQDDHTTYYNQYGVRVTGQQEIDGSIYNFDKNGVVKAGWSTRNGKKVYFQKDGTLAKKEIKIDGKKYNFKKDGTLTTGWQHENNKIQYYNKYGYRVKGWQKIKGKKYYFSEYGNAYTNVEYEGYKFDKKGVAKKIVVPVVEEETNDYNYDAYSYSNGDSDTSTNDYVNDSVASWNPQGSGNNSTGASIAASYLGYNYVWGGASPSGFDCSGLIYYAYNKAGVYMPRSGGSQASVGSAVSYDNMQYGDIIVWDGGNHVSIYVGDGQMVHAANPSTGVITSGVSEWASYGQSITGIRRP